VTWRQGGRAAVFGTVVLAMAGCSDSAQDPGFFTVRPVLRQLPPPCAAPAVAQQGPDGEPVACFELGPPGIDAGDVESAEIQPNPRTGGAEVQFELTSTGRDRFTDLSRRTGLGNQLAIVVDGVVASAPRLQTTEFQGRGVVTGLSPAAADRLVKRLNDG
jgi:preprotein translocase subunit SecD